MMNNEIKKAIKFTVKEFNPYYFDRYNKEYYEKMIDEMTDRILKEFLEEQGEKS